MKVNKLSPQQLAVMIEMHEDWRKGYLPAAWGFVGTTKKVAMILCLSKKRDSLRGLLVVYGIRRRRRKEFLCIIIRSDGRSESCLQHVILFLLC